MLHWRQFMKEVLMLTVDSIIKTTKQMTAFGEGRHRFGHGTAHITEGRVPRDSHIPHKPKAATEPPLEEK